MSKRRNKPGPAGPSFVRITEIGVWAKDLTDEELEDLHKQVLNSGWHKQNLRYGIWEQVKRQDLSRDELVDLIGRIYRAEDKTELDQEEALEAAQEAAIEAAKQAKRDQQLAEAIEQFNKSRSYAERVLAIDELVLPEIIRQELSEAAEAEFSNLAVQRLGLALAAVKPILARFRQRQADERAAAQEAVAKQAHLDAEVSLQAQLSRLATLKASLNGMGQHFDSIEEAAQAKLSAASKIGTEELIRTSNMLEALINEFEHT